jgi:hypothetical protein
VVIDDIEGQMFADIDAATVDAIRQIRSMVSLEIVERGEADLTRAINIVSNGSVTRHVAFSEAISVSI